MDPIGPFETVSEYYSADLSVIEYFEVNSPYGTGSIPGKLFGNISLTGTSHLLVHIEYRYPIPTMFKVF